MRFHAPCSAGDLADRISILTIKMERLLDPEKVRLAREECALLKTEWYNAATTGPELENALAKLDILNNRLWLLEDQAREEIIDDAPLLLRSITVTNDARARVKREVNELLQSEIREVKSHD